MNPEEQKSRVRELLKKHEYEAAVEILNKIEARDAAADDPDTLWAREQQARVRRALDNYRQNRAPAERTAKMLIDRHDYQQAAELLGKFPQRFRTDKMRELLTVAGDRQREVDRLIAEINDALQNQQREGLLAKVEQILELKPGHRQALTLHQRLTAKHNRDAADYSEGMLAGLKGEVQRWQKWLAGGAAVALALVGYFVFRPAGEAPPPEERAVTQVARKPPVEPAPVEQKPRPQIVIDGSFADWDAVPGHVDPSHDEHETQFDEAGEPVDADHVDVDLLEFKAISDNRALYFFWRARGEIGRTLEAAGPDQDAGRYYVNVGIDVDQNDETGYALEEGGYSPKSRGYDVSAEIEFFNGKLNQVRCLHYGAVTPEALQLALNDLTGSRHTADNRGPFPAGLIRLAPGSYDHSSEWVYHEDGTLTLVVDKGDTVIGAATAAVSEDGHQIEARFPFAAFLKDESDRPIIAPGSVLDLSFTLEASGELAPAGEWASDTGEPMLRFTVETLDGSATR